MTDEDKRTFQEWNDSDEFDFVVMDPDGFPRHNVFAMQNNTYTREEFRDRARSSTIMYKPSKHLRS